MEFESPKWALVPVAILAVVAVVIWGTYRAQSAHRRATETAIARQTEVATEPAPTQPAAPSANAVAPLSPATTASSPAPTEPEKPIPYNCHDNPSVQALISKDGRKNITTREEFAQSLNEKGVGQNVTVMSAGDDGEYLMFVAPAYGEEELRGLVNSGVGQRGNRLGVCMAGFAEVQFVVKERDGTQKLIIKSPTTYMDIVDYYRDHIAAPM